MAKYDIDPVLQQLAQAVNDSGQAAAPIMVSVHGTVLNGALISEQRYFSELVEANPLMSALEPSSGLLGKEYTKDAEAASGRHLHLRATAKSARACGASAWKLSTDGPSGLAPRMTAGRSPACSATPDRPCACRMTGAGREQDGRHRSHELWVR